MRKKGWHLMRSLLATTLAVILSLSVLGQASVPRPDAAGNPSSATPTTQNSATPATQNKDAAACGSLVVYHTALNKALDDAGAFSTVLNSSTQDYSTMSPEEGKRIIKDGSTLIAAVKKLNAPPIYADGNKGVVLLLTYLNQEVSFYTVDSSTVPNVDSFSMAAQLIHDGETNAATQCPKEIKKLGGFIFIDPTQIDPGF